MADATYNLNGGFKPTMKRFADLNGPDFFPTPRWATFALIENENFSGEIWESACGDGTMSRVLEQPVGWVERMRNPSAGFACVVTRWVSLRSTHPTCCVAPKLASKRKTHASSQGKRPVGVTPSAFSCNCRLVSGSAAIP
jgi:hypothetical protein